VKDKQISSIYDFRVLCQIRAFFLQHSFEKLGSEFNSFHLRI